MRTGTAAAAAILTVCVTVGVLPRPAASAAVPASLAVSTSRTVPPATVTLSGSCPAASTRAGTSIPTGTVLTLDGSGAGPWKVGLDAAGEFTGFPVEIPHATAPGQYAFATRCGGATPFTVLTTPLLQVLPDMARTGGTAVASGTCTRRFRQVDVLLDGAPLGTALLEPSTGEFGPFSFPVPGGPAGPRSLTTSCGGRTVLTVLAPVAPAPPVDASVVVPDLRGLTVTQAVAALAGRLVLVDPPGGSGRVRRQDPAPGTRVRPGSAVSVVLQPVPVAVAPTSLVTPVVVGVGLALAILLAGALLGARAARRARRRRRERRWLDEHVAVAPGRTYLQLSDVPGDAVPGVDIQVVARRGAARLQLQGARDDAD
jgi:hypothetical protein